MFDLDASANKPNKRGSTSVTIFVCPCEAVCLALFVRFWLNFAPPMSDTAQVSARAKGTELFEGFMQTLGKRWRPETDFSRTCAVIKMRRSARSVFASLLYLTRSRPNLVGSLEMSTISKTERRTDIATKVMNASPSAIYRAFIEAQAWVKWMPPKGMACAIHKFEPHPGGALSLTLTYADQTAHTPGKTTESADTVEGRFVELVENERMVLEIDFVSDDPAFAGTMHMIWTIAPEDAGSEVTITCHNVPPGIRKEDHDVGLNASLENLSAYLAGDL